MSRVYEVIEHTADGFEAVRVEDTFHDAMKTADALARAVGLEFVVAENENGAGGTMLYSSAFENEINGVPTLTRRIAEAEGELAGIRSLKGRI